MSICHLQINNFRNISQLNLLPCEGINIIAGDNGAGKTTILEAIHYLAMARSFRTPTASQLVQFGQQQFNIFAEIVINEAKHQVGLERLKTGSSRLRINNEDVRNLSQLANVLPLRVINSQSHQFFEGGPSIRRKFLDWGAFYHTESFLTSWKNFDRSLRQRNVLLKKKSIKNEIDTWTMELVKYGYEVHHLRKNYIQTLAPLINEIACMLVQLAPAQLNYLSGWPGEESDYALTLQKLFYDELRCGQTLAGPHRADIELSLDDVLMKHFLSRGQQKLMICGIILAQGRLFLRDESSRQLVYLIDDLPAELDEESRNRLLTALAAQDSQVFITAIDSDAIVQIAKSFAKPLKVFHVKQGVLQGASYC